MKQIWPNYSYSPATNVLTLTGLNIDRDQLLLVTAADRGRIMYNFADSSVTASAFTSGANTALTLVATTAGLTTTAALVIYYDDQLASTTVTVSSLPAISGTVTVGILPSLTNNTNFVTVGEQIAEGINNYSTIPVAVNWQDASQGLSGVLVTATCVTSTNRIGVVTIGGGTVTIGAGTAQIGSVTASISGTVPVSISSVTIGNSITIGSCVTHGVTIANSSVTVNGTFYQATQPVSLTTLPALVAGTAQIGSVTASISNSVVTFYPLQGTSVSNTNFTSLTSSTSLVLAVANREVLTVFNEGAGNLHISAGATCTTISYQVRLSAGDYWECPQGQLSLAHTAVFATAGTARVSQVS